MTPTPRETEDTLKAIKILKDNGYPKEAAKALLAMTGQREGRVTRIGRLRLHARCLRLAQENEKLRREMGRKA